MEWQEKITTTTATAHCSDLSISCHSKGHPTMIIYGNEFHLIVTKSQVNYDFRENFREQRSDKPYNSIIKNSSGFVVSICGHTVCNAVAGSRIFAVYPVFMLDLPLFNYHQSLLGIAT